MTMRRIGLLSLLLCLTSGCSAGADPAAESGMQTETGTLEGAAWRSDVPANWNRGLVVYYHGYAVTPVELPQRAPLAPQLKPFVERGYAVIQSAYSATGWAVEQGYADTERLRKQFVDKHG